MSHTSRAPISATLTLAVLLIGVPVWLFLRLTTAPLAFGGTDLVLGVALALWVFVAKAVISRHEAVEPTALSSASVRSHANQLVDQSILGAGFVSGSGSALPAGLHLVSQPGQITTAQLPPELPAFTLAQGSPLGEARATTSPASHSDEPAALSVLDTHDYTVGRGDTFWSVAEAVLGDGREWKQLQTLNLGRQVAPGTMLNENHELSIGWTILVPVIAVDTEAQAG